MMAPRITLICLFLSTLTAIAQETVMTQLPTGQNPASELLFQMENGTKNISSSDLKQLNGFIKSLSTRYPDYASLQRARYTAWKLIVAPSKIKSSDPTFDAVLSSIASLNKETLARVMPEILSMQQLIQKDAAQSQKLSDDLHRFLQRMVYSHNPRILEKANPLVSYLVASVDRHIYPTHDALASDLSRYLMKTPREYLLQGSLANIAEDLAEGFRLSFRIDSLSRDTSIESQKEIFQDITRLGRNINHLSQFVAHESESVPPFLRDRILDVAQLLYYYAEPGPNHPAVYGFFKYSLKNYLHYELVDEILMHRESYKPEDLPDLLGKAYLLLARCAYVNGDYEDAIRFADDITAYVDPESEFIAHYQVNSATIKLSSLIPLKKDDLVKKQFHIVYEMFPEPTTNGLDYWVNHMGIRFQEAGYQIENGDTTVDVRALVNKLGEYDENLDHTFASYIKNPMIYTMALDRQLRNYPKSAIELIEKFFDFSEDRRTTGFTVIKTRALYLKLQMETGVSPDLSNLDKLLRFSDQKINYTFPALAPEQRLSMYNQQLRSFFSLYFSLLVENKIPSDGQQGKEIIRQASLLKRAMSETDLYDFERVQQFADPTGEKINVQKLFREVYLDDQRQHFFGRRDSTIINPRDVIQELFNIYKARVIGISREEDAIIPGANAAMIDFYVFNNLFKNSETQYMAILTNTDGTKQLIPLFSESEFNSIVSQEIYIASNASNRGVEVDVDNVSSHSAASLKLFQLIFAPLRNHLNGVRQLLLCPDGSLNSVAFAALPDESGKLLFEKFNIVQLTHPFVRKKVSTSNESSMLLVGNVDYGAQSTMPWKIFKDGILWKQLPGTKDEISSIRTICRKSGWQCDVVEEKNFTDTTLRTANFYKSIHIATHGYYLTRDQVNRYYRPEYTTDPILENPLFRSALLGSGANESHDSTTFHNGFDGTMLGYELASVDLSKVELITLSACQTGLGDVNDNMGVAGLQRALKLTGASKMLISLWEVPDKETSEFMNVFYKYYLTGASPNDSLEKTRHDLAHKLPLHAWAAFVLLE